MTQGASLDLALGKQLIRGAQECASPCCVRHRVLGLSPVRKACLAKGSGLGSVSTVRRGPGHPILAPQSTGSRGRPPSPTDPHAPRDAAAPTRLLLLRWVSLHLEPPACNLYITFAMRLHISPFQASTPGFFFVIPISFPGLCGLRAQQSLRSEVTPGTSSLFYMQMALHLGSRAGSQTV